MFLKFDCWWISVVDELVVISRMKEFIATSLIKNSEGDEGLASGDKIKLWIEAVDALSES